MAWAEWAAFAEDVVAVAASTAEEAADAEVDLAHPADRATGGVQMNNATTTISLGAPRATAAKNPSRKA